MPRLLRQPEGQTWAGVTCCGGGEPHDPAHRLTPDHVLQIRWLRLGPRACWPELADLTMWRGTSVGHLFAGAVFLVRNNVVLNHDGDDRSLSRLLGAILPAVPGRRAGVS